MFNCNQLLIVAKYMMQMEMWPTTGVTIHKTTMHQKPACLRIQNDPGQVIRDLKTMIQAYHDAGIGVIMDVVYNHTFSAVDAPF